MKNIAKVPVILLFSTLVACAPGAQYTLPPGMTPVPGTDIPQLVASIVTDAFTQTDIPENATQISSGLKPPDSDTPVSGICAEPQGEIVEFTLTSDGPAIPRCAKVMGPQRIKLINATGAAVQVNLAHFKMDIPVGGFVLLDQRVDEYLAPGVHWVNGAEIWVGDNFSPPVVTVPPPIRAYTNSEVGYKLGLPGEWSINESGMINGTNKEVIFSPSYFADPNVIYLSISLDFRTLDQITNFYAQNVPDATREDVNFHGYPGIKYTYSYGRNEYFIPYGDQIYLILTERPADGAIQSVLMSIQFMAPVLTFEVTMADHGRTFNMKPGDRFRLNLDAGYDWSMSVDNPTVIVGAQGMLYLARASGTAALTAFGNPKCYTSTPPCLAPSILFMITVIVQ